MPDGDCAKDTVLFESANGEEWQELGAITTDPAVARPVAETPFGYFAAGVLNWQSRDQPGLWRSSDARQWEPVSDALDTQNCGLPLQGWVSDLVMIPSGLMAVGSGAWLTRDGITWECVPGVPQAEIVSGHGVFVGSGSWVSVSNDGLTWDRTDYVFPGYSEAVPVGDGFVAIGSVSDVHLPQRVRSIATSPDGRTWSERRNVLGKAPIVGVSSDGERALALRTEDSRPGTVWLSSPDGVQWSPYALPRQSGDYASSAVILGDRIVVTGSHDHFGDGGTAIVWVADIP
jgi:hypothetical protein